MITKKLYGQVMTDTKITYLKDYKASPFEITRCDLEFDIYDAKTVVTSN